MKLADLPERTVPLTCLTCSMFSCTAGILYSLPILGCWVCDQSALNAASLSGRMVYWLTSGSAIP